MLEGYNPQLQIYNLATQTGRHNIIKNLDKSLYNHFLNGVQLDLDQKKTYCEGREGCDIIRGS